MIWHIFKKDWKLIWIFVAVVAASQAITEFVLAKARVSDDSPMITLLAQNLPTGMIFFMMFLIAAIVLLDAIPGLRQDWLIRPIPRRDLLLEKLLFTVIAVEGPIFLANLVLGLASGFSLRSVLLVSAERVLYLLFFLVLPIFAFASVTKNMTEAFIFACGFAFLIAVFGTFADYLNTNANRTLTPTLYTGIGWMGELTRFAIVLVAAAVILRFQYFFRKTFLSRALVFFFGFLAFVSLFLPWRPAFAIEERLSPDPAAAKNLSLAFHSQIGRYQPPSGVNNSMYPGEGRDADVFLPLRVSGMHSGDTLITDHGEARLFGSGGKLVYHGSIFGIEVDKAGLTATGEDRHQKITLPASLYKQLQGQPVQAKLDYSFTLFSLSKSYAIPAIGGDERMPGVGWCQTKLNDAGTAVTMKCMMAEKGPTCGGIFLENPSQGTQNPEGFGCYPEYTPYSARPLDDAFRRWVARVSFRDPNGLAKYPVDGPQLPQSRLVIRLYQPLAHFTRSVVIPQLKLGDWQPR
ncbi:MAG TPA: hypothetical protein VKB90_05250 [Candidatus Acidoferrum sp.]|nr:hypothetical protein [Candidatus Acidoferrum sp.]